VLHIPFPYAEEDAIFWMNLAYEGFKEKVRYTFAIAQRETNDFIGAIGLSVDRDHNKAEMGYWVAEPFWNNGIATEAAGALLGFGFEDLELNKIYATHFPHNPASARVMLNNGMIKEGDLVGHYRKGDRYLDVAQYRLTREEYQHLKIDPNC
jgi:RimJ/RimL family protein N-acetyltransferase